MNRIAVLDHGYIELVESWGSDERIIEAARMSTNKGFQGWGPVASERPCHLCKGTGKHGDEFDFSGENQITCESCGGSGRELVAGDEKLLRFLYENNHATPFEMAGLIIEVQAPIFVFREWHRHRTQSYNEMSARYTPLPDINYLPDIDRVMASGGSNKQAGSIAGASPITPEDADSFIEALSEFYDDAEAFYQASLERGVPKELARLCLPVGRYSRMRASANLRNWLAFLTLRMAPKAQWEIRQYANAVGQLVAERFPRTWELFNEERG